MIDLRNNKISYCYYYFDVPLVFFLSFDKRINKFDGSTLNF